MSTATSTMPRSRSPSPSTTSKSKHQHNISEHWRQQISFFSTVCFTGYNEWQEGLKRLHFYCILLSKKLSCQHRTPTSPNTNLPLRAAVVTSCIIQGNATQGTLTGGGAINFAVDEAVCQLRQFSLGQIQIEDSITSHQPVKIQMYPSHQQHFTFNV